MGTARETWRDLYPFRSRFLDIDGLRYHYLDEHTGDGPGEPVVMVHGNPTWSFYYRELIKALRPDYRCIAPDHIGCGLSDKPGDDRYDYRLQSRVDDLAALMDHLGVKENVTLVVHDWGGMIGLAWALRNPEAISRIVILNTSGFFMPKSKRLPWRLRILHGRSALASFAVRRLNLFSRSAMFMATAKGLPRDVRAGLLAPHDSWQNRIATQRFVQDIPLRPRHPSYALTEWVDENLHRLSGVPTLICWGMRDFVFDHHFLSEWRRRFPDAEVHSFADSGHFVLEDACEEIMPLAQEFLRQHSVARKHAHSKRCTP